MRKKCAYFGSEIDSLMKLKAVCNLIIYLSESFEWLIFRSGLFRNKSVETILSNPSDYIESRDYFSWERFFEKLLVEISADTYLKYSKKLLNPNYCRENESENMPETDF